MGYSYIWVDSPFQLLCGIEYIMEFDVENAVLIILSDNNEKGSNQISDIYNANEALFVNMYEFHNPRKEETTSLYFTLNIYENIIKLMEQKGRVERLIMGDYDNCYFRHVSNRVRCDSLFALDDGFGTIRTVSRVKKKSLSIKEYIKMAVTLFKYKPFYNERIIFYTIFYPYINHEKKYLNSFNYLRNKYNSAKTIKSELHFIGSPLVEDGIINYMVYFDYLSRLCDKYKHLDQILYFPHRREKESKINKISNKLDITVKIVDKTIELYELDRTEIPKNITSFFSTALFNLKKILPEEVQISFIRLEENDIHARHKHISNIYEILSQEIIEEPMEDYTQNKNR